MVSQFTSRYLCNLAYKYLSKKFDWFLTWIKVHKTFKRAIKSDLINLIKIINLLCKPHTQFHKYMFDLNIKSTNALLREHIENVCTSKFNDKYSLQETVKNIIISLYHQKLDQADVKKLSRYYQRKLEIDTNLVDYVQYNKSNDKIEIKSYISEPESNASELFIPPIPTPLYPPPPQAPIPPVPKAPLLIPKPPKAPTLILTPKPPKAPSLSGNVIDGLNELSDDFNSDLEVISFTDAIESVPLFTQTISEIDDNFKTESVESNITFADIPYRDKAELNMDVYKEQQKRYKHFKTVDNKPVVERESYRIRNVDDLKETVFKSLTKASLPTKVNIDLHMIVESKYVKDSSKKASKKHSKNEIHYTTHKLNPLVTLDHNSDRTITNVNDIKNLYNTLIEKLNNYIDGAQPEKTASSSRFVALYGIQIVKYNLPSTGAKIEALQKYRKAKLDHRINIEDEDDNLCMFKALVHHNFDNLKAGKQVYNQAVKYYKEFYKIDAKKLSKNSIKCFNWDKEIESFCKHFKVNVHRYTYDFDTKTLVVKSVHEYGFDNLMNVISECEYDEEHIMYCKDISKLTDFLFCPKCGKSFKNNTKTGSHKSKFDKHVSACDGNILQTMIKEYYDVPYCPVFTKNKLYTFCYMYNIKYTPLKYYMTYDFETIDTMVAVDKDLKKE